MHRYSAPHEALSRVERGFLEEYNYASRHHKAFKIERILDDYLGAEIDRREIHCLDIGCSIGVISSQLATVFGQVVGLEPLAEAIGLARRVNPETEASFMQGDGIRLPFPDGSFDVVVCAQVYEHTIDPHQLAGEIYRVLKPGGCCFFSGPNRLWPLEYHYNWLLLHWLPGAILNRFCLWRYGRPYELILLNYWQLGTLWQDFDTIDYTLRLLYDPPKFLEEADPYQWTRTIPHWIPRVLQFLLPNFNWVLAKAKESPNI